MKTIWLKGVKDPQIKTEIRQEFIKSAPLRNLLKTILEDKINAKRLEVRKNNTYDSPSWALVQADAIGYERAMEEIISIIFEEKVQKDENKE